MSQLAMSISTIAVVGALVSAAVSTNAQNSSAPNREPAYISLNQLPSFAQPFLLASGNRLQRPGSERVTVVGSVSRNQGQPTPIQVTWEFPQKIRIDERRAPIVFDQGNPAQRSPDPQSTDTTETLLEDSVEGFFANLREGSTRLLGSGFRLQGAAQGTPSYDIVETWNRSKIRGGEAQTIKRYWFDRSNHLLSRVVYGSAVEGQLVEVFLSDWRDVQGERIPFTIERKEGGSTTLLLRISSATVSPRIADGLFPER